MCRPSDCFSYRVFTLFSTIVTNPTTHSPLQPHDDLDVDDDVNDDDKDSNDNNNDNNTICVYQCSKTMDEPPWLVAAFA